MQKSCSADKSTMYVDNIRQSSERMREMLNTLLGADMECGILMGGGGAVWVRDREVMGHA